ncbi:MAG: (Fe-S)-binding protein [Chloroflexi bacterium]|nr:(Fe-S)-binding protein [Chloroflexota bacterium]
MQAIQQIIKSTKAYYCLECGKCTSVCPISRREPAYSPRLTVERALWGEGEELLTDVLLWSCLTCQHCSTRCPSDVHYVEFIRDLRALARGTGEEGLCSHGEAIQTWMRMMASPELKQNRLDWLDEDLKVSTNSDTVYFVGCLPYYDVLFDKIGAQGVEIAQSAVRVLNRLGIEPIVLDNERCCGHDLLWEGDVAHFRKLAELNIAMLRETGARRIVTTCPECARTLKIDYPAHVGDLEMEVIHITELLADKLARNESRITYHASRITHHASRITYHDPCRLGRHLGVYDAPRQVIEALGLKLVEMEHSGKNALCCGTSCWTNCGAINKQIQVDRLREVRATGAELLITACAKCQIHFKCAMDDVRLGEEVGMEIRDLVTLVDEALG